jgi:ankyrin repeat domain-containing protein 17
MDGHVEVARLLLDHGAQVNMPVDSFESPLTLAACGGHYELAALLLSRGADLEEVNDEGYTPLMEAAREGHEDVVQLLIEHGANVNTQTEETQETALTLACCGGFLEVAQYLVDHGADIELGASTPLMEAAQEGHIDIVEYLINKEAKIDAVTNTMDSALTYACANGHTAIAELLMSCGANVEHESEGGRTPLMKAVRAGHLETAQYLIAKGADVNRCTSNNDHTVLSLACSGGHLAVVQYLLMKGADSSHILKDNSTMIIEAARGGHTAVVSLLLRQPRFTEALRNQMLAQRQTASLSANDQRMKNAAVAKRKARISHAQSEPIKQQKKHGRDEEAGLDDVTPPTSVIAQNWLPINPQLMGMPQPFQFQSHAPPHQILQQSMSLPGSPLKGFPAYSYQPHPQFVSNHAPIKMEEEKVKDSVTFPSTTTDSGTLYQTKPLAPLHPPPPPHPGGGNYLLPTVFAESSVYSNEVRMEAYLKADEILRNHMSQMDYPKQQALMNALESLMVQSEAHRASMVGTGESGEGGGYKSVQEPHPPPQSSWSFTDPSRMPKFAVGVSTLAPSSGASPDRTSSRSLGCSPMKQEHPPSMTNELPSINTMYNSLAPPALLTTPTSVGMPPTLPNLIQQVSPDHTHLPHPQGLPQVDLSGFKHLTHHVMQQQAPPTSPNIRANNNQQQQQQSTTNK